MSYYHLSVNIISRGKGQSAVASASYRSGEALYSEIDMEVKSYKPRTVQPETMILAPEHAPDWVYNRERLWNEVEHKESNINARLAREVRLALPIELSNEKQTEIVKKYVQENFVNEGMVADVAIHRDVPHNPHVHIMLTTRPFNQDGTWGNKKKKEYILDENGQKVLDRNGKPKFRTIELTNWDRKETLEKWRENWAKTINEAYKEVGINKTVSHESYEKQGIDKIATHRLTWEEYQAEKEAQIQAEINGEEYVPVTHMGEVNHQIRKANELQSSINQKIVSLEEYKETIKRDMRERYIPEIKQSISLSDEQRNALKFVAKRINKYVTFDTAKDNLKRVKYWGISVENKLRNIKAEKSILDKAIKAFDERPRSVLQYGYLPNTFNEIKDEKFRQLDEKLQSVEGEFNKYQETYRNSQIAYDVQKQFVHAKFAELYPQYADIVEGHNDKLIELKYEYVKKHNEKLIVVDRIEELENPKLLAEYKLERVKDQNIIKDWTENQNSLLIANRTVAKASREYSQAWKEFVSSESVYTAYLKLETFKHQVVEKENIKEDLNYELNVSLNAKYQGQEDVITELPPEIKVELLKMNLEGTSTGELYDDLRTVESLLSEKNKDFNIDNLFKAQYSNSSGLTYGISSVFQNLLIQAQRNQKGISDDQRRRNREKKLKSKSIEKENELEL